MQPLECIPVVRIEAGPPGLVQIAFDILESGLQTVQKALKFLEFTARDDQFVGSQPVRSGQFSGHMRLLAASLLAIAPAPAGTLLFRQFPAAPPAPGLGQWFRHVTRVPPLPGETEDAVVPAACDVR
jgi:hypothetical protein